eukprot:GFUD01105638.1.p1 GENE.GFUD01105638.1~~GFUD01105638.1.p1  ORF type:complete len:511 (-),score=100.83 GFUD01105638.1:901-2433(-)
MKVSNSSMKKFVCLCLPMVLVVSGLILLTTHHNIFMYIYKSQLVLSPESGSFPMWQDLPTPMLASMYLFNVSNPDEVSKGAKPELEEFGPYVFTEQHHKTKLAWNENGTITYRQIRTWHFVPELSSGSLDDNVTIVNSVAATIGAMINQNVAKSLRFFPNVFLRAIKESLFVTKTVREIIFDGYHDPLFDNVEELIKLLPWVKKMIPEGSVMDKFAFFYGRNGTDYTDGVFNMFTGAGRTDQMGEVHSWNYSTRGLFPGQCGQVRGGAGEFYPPGLEKTFIEMFSNDLCRTLRLNFNKEVTVKGINSYEYRADRSFFANGTENTLNACYEPAGVFLPSGVYNTSICRFGAPVFVSQPHFYQADPYYLDMIASGLSPNSTLHSTYFRVEPRAGVPTDVSARFQLNVLVDRVSGITMLNSVNKTYFPVMWFENKAGVPDSLAFKMKLLANLPEILQGMGWAQIGLSLAICIIATLVMASKRKVQGRLEDTSPILNQSIQEDSRDENVFLDQE